MHKISVNLTNDRDENQLNYNNNLPAIWKMNYVLQKPFETDFLTVIGNSKLRPSFVISWVAQGSRPRCGPRHPILHSNIFFYVKLFATIILSWNWLKYILWHFLNCRIHLLKMNILFFNFKCFKSQIWFCTLTYFFM